MIDIPNPYSNTTMSASMTCILHTHHGSSTPYYTELHHIIPQAWQRFWQPPLGDNLTADDRAELWDPRTEPLCPNGHRNVHYFIVRYMRAWHLFIEGLNAAQSEATIKKVIDRELHLMRLNKVRVNRNEANMAADALLRYDAAGGNLKDLCDAKLWGQA